MGYICLGVIVISAIIVLVAFLKKEDEPSNIQWG